MIDDFMQELFGGSFNARFGAMPGQTGMPIMRPPGNMAPTPLMPRPAAAPAQHPDISAILRGALAKRQAEDAVLSGATLPERDRVQATRDAIASGDYVPSVSGGMTYRGPIRPQEDVDPVLRGTDFSDAKRKNKSGQKLVVPGDVATDGPSLEGDAPPAEPLLGKRTQAALAGGMSDADARFKGGAFMKGFSGGLKGGLASDKADRDAADAAATADQKQANIDAELDIKQRALSDREKTSAAQRRLMGIREKEIENRPRTKSWDKPAHERFKDAQTLIIQKNREIDRASGANNALLPPAARTEAAAKAQSEKDAFRIQTLRQYGLNEDGSEAAPPRAEVPSSRRVVGDREAEEAGLYEKPSGGKMLGTGTDRDPFQPRSREDFAGMKPGQVFRNPADGKLIRFRGVPQQ